MKDYASVFGFASGLAIVLICFAYFYYNVELWKSLVIGGSLPVFVLIIKYMIFSSSESIYLDPIIYQKFKEDNRKRKIQNASDSETILKKYESMPDMKSQKFGDVIRQ